MGNDGELWVCRTCGVEHASRVAVCAICDDERQWVPASGQAWARLDELAAEGVHVRAHELEPGLAALEAPGIGIEQQSKLLTTEHGALLWDPLGFVDDAGLEAVTAAAGPSRTLVVAASHPHMFGVQVEWSRRAAAALGRDVPVLVERARRALGRPSRPCDPHVAR